MAEHRHPADLRDAPAGYLHRATALVRRSIDEGRTRVWLALGATLILWASGFVGVSVAVTEYSPAHLALFRFLIASVVLFGWLLHKNGRLPLPKKSDLRRLALVGLFGVPLYHLPLNAGQQVVGAGVSSMLVATAPIFTAIVSGVVLGERVSRRTWSGISVAFVGTALLVLSQSGGHGLAVQPEALLILLAALAFAGYVVTQRPLVQRYGGLSVAAWAIWIGTSMLLPFLPGLVGNVARASLSATLAAVYLGVVPGALGYVTYAFVLKHLPAAKAGSALYAVPPLAVIMAWIALGDRPTAATLLSGAIVLAGVGWANVSNGKKAKAAKLVASPSCSCSQASTP
jgi:drug/metabolite transporter (DMT)-like permease